MCLASKMHAALSKLNIFKENISENICTDYFAFWIKKNLKVRTNSAFHMECVLEFAMAEIPSVKLTKLALISKHLMCL